MVILTCIVRVLLCIRAQRQVRLTWNVGRVKMETKWKLHIIWAILCGWTADACLEYDTSFVPFNIFGGDVTVWHHPAIFPIWVLPIVLSIWIVGHIVLWKQNKE